MLSVAKRAEAANYTPPLYKFNTHLEGYRDAMLLLMAPEKTTLINIDIQNVYSEEGGAWFVPGAQETIPYVNRLASYCREHNMPVIWVLNTVRKDGSDAGMEGRYYPETLPPRSLLAPDQHWWELDSKVDNKPTDIYVRKPKFDAFWGSDLEAVLRGLGVESVIFTGLDTAMCVHETLVGAFHKDYNCVLAMDATAGRYWPQEDWYAFEEYMYSRVLTTDEIIVELEALAP